MLDGVLSLISSARVGFIGMYRDEETLEPVEYYAKLPADVAERDVILLDPMLATGNSTVSAIETVKKAGAASIRLIAIIAAPEGIERITAAHPDVYADTSPAELGAGRSPPRSDSEASGPIAPLDGGPGAGPYGSVPRCGVRGLSPARRRKRLEPLAA